MPRTRRLVLTPLLAVALGALVGAVGLGASLALAGRVDTDRATMADLGVAVLGLVLSVGAGVVTWLVMLVRGAVALFPAGRRLAPVLWSAVATFGLIVLWTVVAGLLDDGAGLAEDAADALLLVGMLLVLAAPSAVFVAWDRACRRRADPSG